MEEAVILSACRTPIGSFGGVFKDLGVVDLAATAVREAVRRAGVEPRELEAFAAQALAVARELGLDPARINVNGGAVALGHPIGSSGARILTTLIHTMRRRAERYGVAALCIGGGMGIAMVVEVA